MSTLLHRCATWLLNRPVAMAVLRRVVRPKGIFVCYPANRHFADHFSSPGRQTKSRWLPHLIGVIRQGSSLSLMFAISSNERDFSDPLNRDRITELHARCKDIQRRFGAEQLSFAGVLPGILRRRRLVRVSIEAEMASWVLSQAVREIIASGVRPHARRICRIVVLGAKGFVGREVVKRLHADIPQEIARVVGIDKNDPIPQDGPALFVNCSLPGVIEALSLQIPPGSMVLHEVYPAPEFATLQSLTSRGIQLIHVAGVEGTAWPPFPGEYGGAIPCCAALSSEPAIVVLKSLNGTEGPSLRGGDIWDCGQVEDESPLV